MPPHPTPPPPAAREQILASHDELRHLSYEAPAEALEQLEAALAELGALDIANSFIEALLVARKRWPRDSGHRLFGGEDISHNQRRNA